MKNPSILPNQRGKMQIDTFGNVLMFKNCSAYPHGPAKHKIIEKFLRTLHVFRIACLSSRTSKAEKMNFKKDYETIYN